MNKLITTIAIALFTTSALAEVPTDPYVLIVSGISADIVEQAENGWLSSMKRSCGELSNALDAVDRNFTVRGRFYEKMDYNRFQTFKTAYEYCEALQDAE